MITKAALDAAKAAYDIEAACITEMKDYFDDAQFAKAVELLRSGDVPFRKIYLHREEGLTEELML